MARPIDPPSDESPTTVVRIDDLPTTHLPVVTAAPAAPSQSWVRRIAPWAGFGVLAVVVIAGTTAWSASLRSPDHRSVLAADAPVVTGAPSTTPVTPSVTAEPTVKRTGAAATSRRQSSREATTTRARPQPATPARTAGAPVAPTTDAAATTTRSTRTSPLLPGPRCDEQAAAPGGGSPRCSPTATTPTTGAATAPG